MFLLFLLLLAGTLFFLHRARDGGAPPWVRHSSPEHEAKRILAQRFASGEISSDDFLERASVLNWTPGSDTWPTSKKKGR